MKTRDLIVEACALIDIEAKDRTQAIREMVAALAAAGRLKDGERCLGDVLARERQHSAGIGGGIAIPHACTPGVCQPLLAIGRCVSGLDFQALDNEPVKLIYIGIKAPNRLEHRYLTEDVPMSLVPMASLGDHLGVPVPAIRAFIHLAFCTKCECAACLGIRADRLQPCTLPDCQRPAGGFSSSTPMSLACLPVMRRQPKRSRFWASPWRSCPPNSRRAGSTMKRD